ncbi:hypothetical protein ACFWYW_43130 [Nonomuraea sp. NPDC059023]|uniref:hypothetical protein n=1 Tax=unclassified Nonomuraea TaxID=2593643 RepID=UPI0036B3F67E
MDGKLILTIRLDCLLADLDRISGAVTDAIRKREHMREVMDALQEAENAVGELASNAAPIKQELARPGKGRLGDLGNRPLTTSITDLDGHIRAVEDGVARIRETIEPLSDRMVELEKQTVLEEDLRAATGNLRFEAEKLRDRLDSDGADLPELWRGYAEFVKTEAEPVYDNYVEFVAGLAMRDSAVEDSVCMVTDHLLTRMLGPHQALSLPSRTPAFSMRAVIKLGFPDWNIWGVPLAAREAGASVVKHAADKARMLNELLARPPTPYAARLAEDALAAFMLGPAYARAMFTFRLHPSMPSVANLHPSVPSVAKLPPDTLRAQMILSMLRLAGPADGQDAFAEEVDQLEDFWTDLLRQLGVPPEPVLDPDFCRHLHTALHRDRLRGFSAKNWADVQTCADHLLLGDTLPPLTPVDRVVILLNAGWVARHRDPLHTNVIAGRLMHHLKHDGTGRSPDARSGGRPLTTRTPRGT